ncbi:hypothetical protein ASE25_11415 [Terrabacter sp. Root85]|uniref:hypothetical protein n=1 Tax=Terrabacter sp. Root85 TaxID=1736603 RepID=UPI00070198B4|nr:hypothetical protein [Terrabacter sp. Root85]KRC90090.1 hypothetical protein ASE25_11415 [Terrabacter sp. Root85]
MGALDTEPTLGTSSSIGRYFGIVSTIPSLVLVLWVYLILVLDPFHGPPQLSHLGSVNPITHPSHAIAIAVAAWITAVVTHPLQTAIVQAFEGYWGFGHLGRRLAAARVLAHLKSRATMTGTADWAVHRLKERHDALGDELLDHLTYPALPDNDSVARSVVELQLKVDTARKALLIYPSDLVDMMPTRLGNVLRRHETLAGRAVNLPILQWATHIGLSADPAHNAYVVDQRSDLDLAVRMSFVGVVCTGLSFIAFWPHGLWLLLALVPLAGGWLSYRGSVVAADAYGRAFSAWLHLNRFRMYDQLRLVPAETADDERKRNAALEDLVHGNDTFEVPLAHGPKQ